MHILTMVCQEAHKVLVLKQHVLLDDADVGLGLPQLVQLVEKEVTDLNAVTQQAHCQQGYHWILCAASEQRPESCLQNTTVGHWY